MNIIRIYKNKESAISALRYYVRTNRSAVLFKKNRAFKNGNSKKRAFEYALYITA